MLLNSASGIHHVIFDSKECKPWLTLVETVVACIPTRLLFWFFLDFSGKGEVRFRSFDLGTGRWIFAGIRSCVQ